MHKIYQDIAPTKIRSLFVINNSEILRNARKTRNVTEYFKIPKIRLAVHDKSLFSKGPKLYNRTCTQFNKSSQKTKLSQNDLPLQERYARPFKNACKGFIFDLQSAGDTEEWATINFPIHSDFI